MKIITCIAFFLFWSIQAWSQLSIQDDLESILRSSEPVYLVDDGGQLSFSDVSQMRFADSLATANAALRKMNRTRAVWARFDLLLVDTVSEEIALRTARFARSRVYLVGEGRLDSIDIGFFDLGFLVSESEDEFAANLGIETGKELTVYVRAVNNSHILFSDTYWIDLFPRSVFDGYIAARVQKNRASTYFYVFFCGLLLFQLFYVAFQWSLVRRREYLYYGLYILMVFFYFYNRFSVFHAHLLGISLVDAEMMVAMNNILLVLPTYFYFVFARYFVDLKENDPRLFKQFKWFERFLLACTIFLVIWQVFPSDFPVRIILSVVLGVQFLFSIYAMIRVYRIKSTIGYFLIAGSACVLFSHLLANISPYAMRWLLSYIAPLTITMYGILLEIAIFNTGLLFKAKGEEREKVRVHRAYISELQNRQRIQTEYNQVRDKIASDLHDDIGSSLSSINIYSYAASQKLNQGELDQANGLLKNIERSAFNTLASMSDLVWAINPNNDSPLKLLERVQSFGYEVITATEARFEIEVDPEFYDATLSQAERKNVLLILKEAINNAAKYAEASVVKMTVSKALEGGFVFSLSDDGKGIPAERRDGNGLRNMRARAEELGGFFEVESAPGGTKVRFGLRSKVRG